MHCTFESLNTLSLLPGQISTANLYIRWMWRTLLASDMLCSRACVWEGRQ